MKISIITINWNNAAGLNKTLESAFIQDALAYEHIIVDGASTDESVSIIKDYSARSATKGTGVKWVSEPDNGIYNAMNKGISMATGDYLLFLNSGDRLADASVIGSVIERLMNSSSAVDILYGNVIKEYSDGCQLFDNCGGEDFKPDSFLYFYRGTLNHCSSFIRRELFVRFGTYNEQLKICSDWEWWLRSIVIGGASTMYYNVTISIFDMGGVSENDGENHVAIIQERQQSLEAIFPPRVLLDYHRYASDIEQMRRIKRHKWAYCMVWLLERVLLRVERVRWNH